MQQVLRLYVLEKNNTITNIQKHLDASSLRYDVLMKRTAVQPYHNPTVLQTPVFRLERPHVIVFTFGHRSGETERFRMDQQNNVAPVDKKNQ